MFKHKREVIEKEKKDKEFIQRIKFFLEVSGNLTRTALKRIYLRDRKKYPLYFKEYQIYHKDKK